MVTDELLNEAKTFLHVLHSNDDENIKNLINRGHVVVQSYCGNFDFDNELGKGLVMEYVRFAYNNMAEWFYSSHQTLLINLQAELSKGVETNVEDTMGKV